MRHSRLVLPRKGFIALSILTLPCALVAQQPAARTLRATTTDTAGRPVAYVNVLMGAVRRTIANDSGYFHLDISTAGAVEFDLLRMGYRRQHVTLETVPDSVIRIALVPVAQTLPGQLVATRGVTKLDRAGFYNRLKDVESGINRGYFLTEEDIDWRKPGKTTDLFRNLPEIKLTRFSSGSQSYYAVTGTDGCGMTVFLDGIRMNDPSAAGSNVTMANTKGPVNRNTGNFGSSVTQSMSPITPELDNLILPGSISGIEIYPKAVSGPPKYQSMAGTCGVVLIWTH